MRSYIQPYIGICDFSDPTQVERILRVTGDRGLDPKMDHVLGVGLMTSYKTLHDLPSRWATAWPPKESIAGIFIANEQVFNILHYADYDNLTTADDYRAIRTLGGCNLNAVQLDMIWPDVDTIKQGFRCGSGQSEDIRIILQVGARAMEAVGNDPEKIAERLFDYHEANCLDYVLLDKSMGRGLGMDAELLLSYHRVIRKHFRSDELGIVVAGGLGPTSIIKLLEPFRRDDTYLDISIDAQGQLRPSGNALNPIDWKMAEDYYAEATMYFGWL